MEVRKCREDTNGEYVPDPDAPLCCSECGRQLIPTKPDEVRDEEYRQLTERCEKLQAVLNAYDEYIGLIQKAIFLKARGGLTEAFRDRQAEAWGRCHEAKQALEAFETTAS